MNAMFMVTFRVEGEYLVTYLCVSEEPCVLYAVYACLFVLVC